MNKCWLVVRGWQFKWEFKTLFCTRKLRRRLVWSHFGSNPFFYPTRVTATAQIPSPMPLSYWRRRKVTRNKKFRNDREQWRGKEANKGSTQNIYLAINSWGHLYPLRSIRCPPGPQLKCDPLQCWPEWLLLLATEYSHRMSINLRVSGHDFNEPRK